MDNFTHSLAGVLLAEGALQIAAKRGVATSIVWKRGVYAVSILSNNLPDFDFVYTRITEGKLGYLLHHRGHTHTVLAAILAAVCFWLGSWIIGRRRGSERKWRIVAAVGAVGPFIHLALDYTNNYGVHPFWPIDNRWYYGDSVFIVEPLLWAAVVPPVVLTVHSWFGRAAVALPLLGALVAACLFPVVPWFSVALLVATCGAAVASALTIRAASRVNLAVAGWLLVTGVFVSCGRVARSSVASTSSLFPAASTEDVVLTPFPANPLCWSLLAVQTEGSDYVLRAGVVATAPALIPAEKCPRMTADGTTAPVSPLRVDGPKSVRWESEFRGSRRTLATLFARNCHARSFLRFARAPFWTTSSPKIIGDLRYDRDPGVDFAEIPLPAGGRPCPKYVPNWTPPRSDVLGR